ncbi:hypothetical protein FB45DRAFT_909437 [Roridomyces roridus]|uniref:Uncharacterized protein n=1 Tax=Roridomyces roridus TaxID=1738132 RepID=A0AAD7BYX5_9AGAR|nr:hypothetical protein FB45DRAFT_909437 [Roridomyces roridus]
MFQSKDKFSHDDDLTHLQVKERELPPLPYETRLLHVPERNSSKIHIPSWTPSTHAVVFPKSPPNSGRPQLRLETGWNGTSPFVPSQRQRTRSDSSQECLLHPESPDDPTSPYQFTRSQTVPTPLPRSTNCRFLSGVRLPKFSSVVGIAQSTTLTTRATNPHNFMTMPQPFIKSDGLPSEGIIITVHREERIEEPVPMRAFGSSSSISLVSNSSSRSLLTQHITTKDLPAIPLVDDDVESDDEQRINANASSSDSQPPSSSPALVTAVHVGRGPIGAKRRKHYRIHRVPPPLV